MKKEFVHSAQLLFWTSLLGLVLLTACSRDDGDKSQSFVNTQFNFSLPFKNTQSHTRMGGDVVQKDGTDKEFRGITDVKLFCFDSVPTESSTNIGNIIDMKTSGNSVATDVTTDDLSICQDVSIPVSTSYFGFFARANDAPMTHEEKMKYGIIETVGLDRVTYKGNSAIRFKPVPICTSESPFGGSQVGQNLLDLLNDLMSTTSVELAPNNKWSTVNNIYMNEAYQRMTALKALSSDHVQIMLAAINRLLNQDSPDDQGELLRSNILSKIAAACVTAPLPTSPTITLKPEYQGFPDDIHLPAGSARIEWDATQEEYIVPDSHSYGGHIQVASINDYVYPMNLQYQVYSDIVASDNLVIQTEEGTFPADQYQNWDDLLQWGYQGASKAVSESTQSVAMVKQVEYAVGRLALQACLSSSDIYDAKKNQVDVTNGFTLKGYLVGGQREVDYNFQPVSGSKEYAIYDTDLSVGLQTLQRSTFTEPDYILGLGTDRNKDVNLALELVNDCDDFWGADGLIAHGATFYLVVCLKPSEGTNYSSSLNQIFSRDRATQVRLTVTSLSSATYGLPNLEILRPTVGISVDLSWQKGLTYDEVIL